MPTATELAAPAVSIERRIHRIREQRVMLDSDLAALYGVTTGALNQAVRRNTERFPDDFMFTLGPEETGRGGRRTPPSVVTEHGVAMLSSVLNSQRAIQVNIMICRAFVRMRELVAANKDIATRIEKLERTQSRTASVIEILVEDIDRLALDVCKIKALPRPRERKIGFSV